MISWIIFLIGVIVSISLGYFTNVNIFEFWEIVIIFIVALVILILLNAICAIVCSKWLPNKLYNAESKFFSPNKKEYNFYIKLGVKVWKDKTIEWGKLNGFSKSKIEEPKSPEYINRFILECNKGYLSHLTSLFIATFIFLCVPKTLIFTMALPMFITSFILNSIPIIILRYNIVRLKILLLYSQRNKKTD